MNRALGRRASARRDAAKIAISNQKERPGRGGNLSEPWFKRIPEKGSGNEHAYE